MSLQAMDSGNLGSRFGPQNVVPPGQHSRFRYGIHFANAPADVRRVDLETLFNEFGPCRLRMEPGATFGWVGYDSIQECNSACDGMNPNTLGMYIRKGPYEAGPMLRPPTGGPIMGRSTRTGLPMSIPAVGGPRVVRSAMGGAQIVRSAMGRPSMGVPFMGGPYPRNYGLMPHVPRGPPMEFFEEEDYYDYFVDPYDGMDYGYEDFNETCLEQPGCDVGPCTTCAARTSYSCERCGAFYCSEKCQRRDWNTHRELCDKNIPSLNFGPRNRASSANILEERMQRLAMKDGREDGSSFRPNTRTQEGRSPGEHTPPTARRQNDDRCPEGEIKGHRRDDDALGDRRPDSAVDRGNRFNENGFGDRRGDGDRQPKGERRNEGGFGDRRGDGERKPMAERRNEGGFGDGRGDGDRKPMGDRRNDGGFGDRRNEGGFGNRRNEGDRKSMGERRNEGGFGDRRNEGGFSDRRNEGDRKPMGERRNEGGFSDRRNEGDRKPMGERRNEGGFGDRRNEGGFGDRRNEGRSGNRRNEGGFGDHGGDGDRKPMGDRRNEGGFGDRRGDGDRKPVGESRNEGSFGDRRGDGDRRPRNENGFGDRGQGENQNRHDKFGSPECRPRLGENKNSGAMPEASSDKAKSESPNGTVLKSDNCFNTEVKTTATTSSALNKSSGGGVSPTEAKSDLVAEKSVCVEFKMNDTVVITHVTSLDDIFVTPPTSAFSEDFKKVIVGIAAHCKDAPVLQRAPVPDEVVACQFTFDNDFYRAILKETLPGGEYLMQFCDYGNMQKCGINKLKAIPDYLKECPWNGMNVSLSGVGKVPIKGPIQKLFVDLTDQEVNLKLQFDGDISRGVVLVKPNGISVNDEVKSLIGEEAEPRNTDTSAPKIDAPAPKINAPAPKINVPAPAKETVAFVSSNVSSQRTSDEVLSSLLTKASMPGNVPVAPYPAEEGVCIELKNDNVVIITASTGTGSTYVTRFPESTEMTQLAKKLDEHCKVAPSLSRVPRDKEVVACQYVDKLYYRASVTEVLPNAEYIMTFCDYGNTTKCKIGDLKEVPGELKVLPRQAVQVYFRGVDPVPVTGKIGAILDELSCEETQLKLRFSGSIENGVELIRPDGKSVNEELRAVLAQAPKPVDDLAVDSAELAEDFSPAASVPLPFGKPFSLLVFGILGDFIVAACNADAPEIEQFEKNCAPLIVEYCQKAKETEFRPEPGQMCLAKFNDDWFRALAMDVKEDGARDVFFVDYGNTSKVQPSDIRKIPPEIRTVSHMLTLCSIVGVPETPDVWSKIKTHIEREIELKTLALFVNVTAVKQTDSTAEITIPLLNKL